MSSKAKNNQIILRNRDQNRKYKLSIKKSIKNYLFSLQNSKIKNNSQLEYQKVCMTALSMVYKRLDKAVKRKVLHKNTAARKKARLVKMLK